MPVILWIQQTTVFLDHHCHRCHAINATDTDSHVHFRTYSVEYGRQISRHHEVIVVIYGNRIVNGHLRLGSYEFPPWGPCTLCLSSSTAHLSFESSGESIHRFEVTG